MKLNHSQMPLFDKLAELADKKPISFHVPGHKNGEIFLSQAKSYYEGILPIDMTELSGLDDLHAPKGVIADAERLAACYFQADATFFLVGGSTVGNLSMILAACSAGDKIIVQRNSHKSIMNGLELSGADPILINPQYDPMVDRYTAPSYETVKQAIQEHPDAKAVVLTYPDYFGGTYEIEQMIDTAHQFHIPVFVDEAHGVHFSLGTPFPTSALELGADIVVQSAHKMAPAMTMASYLHINSNIMKKDQIAYYLQMLQSSSPSYPLMASLDIGRSFLATLTKDEIKRIIQRVNGLKAILEKGKHWKVLKSDDPLKFTLHVDEGMTGYEVASYFEKTGVYPELATHNQVLFVDGLQGSPSSFTKIEKAIKTINEQLKSEPNHATIDISGTFAEPMKRLDLPYREMNTLQTKKIPLTHTVGHIAAEAIIPYPPGIPLVAKGEMIELKHIRIIEKLMEQGATIQHRHIEEGIHVFTGVSKGEEHS
ncbi:lysine decarboxylase [Oceanobacillus limi]|uniref:Lysine decarboxylase n=1 Tax=Oceanobacillus limi TaxID=930131 RepID=A0A1I0GVH0_9BACI|nr:aminotransferase class I/II-fold pyridoxal phosphate-dependent enzyme [Oceanobacillus limi]SET74436.1 lysine decarboxylase [Oceanobacillus limi]